MQQLVSLGLLARQDAAHAEQAIVLLENILASWVEANPPLTGIHYVSAMECALRLIAVCHALDMVRTKLTTPEQTWTYLLQLVMSHAGLIVRRLSLYSSAGNHTIAEACGLVYAGAIFPELSDANHWKTVGVGLLAQEAARQIFSDGGSIEQALGYQVFIIDLLGLVQLLLEDRCEPVPVAISNAVRCGRTFLMTFGQNRQNIPSIGDQDGGHALSRHLQISWKEDLNPRLKHITFSDSGYTVLYNHLPPIQLVFDHGPLGMAPCFAHGHADALSVSLNCCDREILIDPGTFTYTGDTLWRTYFRGTRAHNTVTVDNLDQAVQETAFMWAEPFHSQVVFKEESPDSAVTILASHNGYAKRVGVTHWRAVLFNPPATWLVWDRVTGDGVHHLELNWHLGTEPNAWADRYTLPCNGNSLCLAIEGGINTIHCGETDPVSGWRSRQYGMKEPISTIRTVFDGSLPHEFLTRIWVGVNQTLPELCSDKLAELRRLTS
ncbi:MAG: alginate lyase family protein [Nitrospira sp.]|nr:alginate lyase family protein [Nitrospira sp.]